MMRQQLPPILMALVLACVAASPLAAQLRVPGLPTPAPRVESVISDLTSQVDETFATLDRRTIREARRLLRQRERIIEKLVRANRDIIERDIEGKPARRGELLAIGASVGMLRALEEAGFRILERERIASLEIEVVRLAVPRDSPLAEAQRLAAGIAPELELAPDHLHLEAAQQDLPSSAALAPLALAAQPAIELPVGIIDGGAGKSVPIAEQKGFARGAPLASDHGSAVASLLHSAGARRLMVADVYGDDPAGGNALAIAKALGWLTARGCRVVTISLVGPRNALLERAVAAAQGRGVVVVAAVGNDGPAAPPAYPASYDSVLAITGVDPRGRALIEAGRALHLDYAAPGARVRAHDANGRTREVRGTSFAAPLAAARVASALAAGGDWRLRLDREARDLGPKGPDKTYGRGLLCGECGGQD